MDAGKEARSGAPLFDEAASSRADVLVVCDAQGGIVFASSGTESLLGLPPAELIGRPMTALIPDVWDDRHGAHAATRADGEVRIDVTIARFGDLQLLALRDAAPRLALWAVLEGLPDATVAAQSDGRIIFVNTRAEELFGYTRDELLGQPVEVLWPESVRDRYRRNMDLYFAAEHPLRFTMEARGLRRDGSEFAGEMSWGIVNSMHGPLLLAIGRDISARRQALERLQRHANEQAAVVALGERALSVTNVVELSRDAVEYIRNTLTVGRVIVTDRHGHTLATSPGENPGGEVREFELRAGEQVLGALTVASVAGATLGEGEQRFLRAIAHVLAMAAERAAADDRLRGAQKMEAVGQLAGGIAHDFNNLLTVISGYLEIVRRRLPGDVVAEELAAIADAADRATQVTRQLLAFSRQQLREVSVLDLNDVCRSVLPMLERLIGEDITVTALCAESQPRVIGDRGQLVQVILNLAINARDAMPSGGALTIETSQSADGMVELVVRDTGTGMAPEIVERIFEPFFTTKRAGHGTGLGLATVHGIVEQSGGHVAVQSQPGVGSTFTISLPAAPPTGDDTHEAPTSEPDRFEGRETVVLCEDEEPVRRLVERILTSRGYSPLVAARPSDALRLAANHAGPIDALISDVIMPDMSGPELADRIRAMRPGIRTLFVSGYTAETLHARGGLPADSRFVQKPFTADALLESLRDLLDRT
jgi:two-component system, cell cycle sensor histidine kinase and response regulator CckA